LLVLADSDEKEVPGMAKASDCEANRFDVISKQFSSPAMSVRSSILLF
jgi:hypothetical protein